MQLFKTVCVLITLGSLHAQPAAAQISSGAQAGEGEPDRRQQWLVPSPDPATAAHAILFRPPGEGPFPLAIVPHATSQNVLRRAQMPQPEYRALASWLVASGSEGHWLVATESGVKSAAPELDRARKAPSPTAAKKR
jgi:hypothetical protein